MQLISSILLRRELEIPHAHHANRPNRPRHHPLHRPRHNPQPACDESKYRCHHHGEHLPSPRNNHPITHYIYSPKLTSKTGHKIPRRHRLPTPNRTPRPLPQMGQHESERHSQQRRNCVLARCARCHWYGGWKGEWCCCGAECAYADSGDCVGVS
jgi:hypothetical protein